MKIKLSLFTFFILVYFFASGQEKSPDIKKIEIEAKKIEDLKNLKTFGDTIRILSAVDPSITTGYLTTTFYYNNKLQKVVYSYPDSVSTQYYLNKNVILVTQKSKGKELQKEYFSTSDNALVEKLIKEDEKKLSNLPDRFQSLITGRYYHLQYHRKLK
jgi:hypothetical protein